MAGDARHGQCPNLLIATRRCSPRCSFGREYLFHADRRAGVPYYLILPD